MEDDINTRVDKIRSKINTYDKDPETVEKEQINKDFNELTEIMRLIASQSRFSPNEEFDDIKTEDIRLLLVPYYQAELLLKLMDDREKRIKLSVQFYTEFHKILKSYKYLSKESIQTFEKLIESMKDSKGNLEKNLKQGKPDFDEMSKQREHKIKAFKLKKELEAKIQKLEKDNLDDTREYWTALLDLHYSNMLDTLKSLGTELESIEFISGGYKVESKEKLQKKMETLRITPDTIKDLDPGHKLLQNVQFGGQCNGCTDINADVVKRVHVKEQVFRNRNQPTMTLDEFADKQIELMNQQKIAEEESKKEQEMEEALDDDLDEEVDDRRKKEKRAWDDWKDAHERGAGNKKR